MDSPTPARVPADAPFFIVINAASGSNDALDTRASISAILDAAGRRHEFLPVDEPGRLPEVAARAVIRAKAEQGIVVGVGGDGTLNAVARAVIGSGRPYGVLPQGTFNYFGRVNGISQDIQASTRALLNARVEPVQVGRLNDQVFLVNASLGLYPHLLEDREAAKEVHGRSRVVAFWAGLRTLWTDTTELRLDIESEGKHRSIATPTLFVGNNRLQLERIGIAEQAVLERGMLAVVMVRPVGKLAMLWLALRGALGRLGDADNVDSLAVTRLTVTPRGRRSVKVALDGEVMRMQAPLVFKVSAEPLQLLVPAPADRVDVA